MKTKILITLFASSILAFSQGNAVNGKGDGITDSNAFKEALELENVNNTSDINKPVSNATQDVLDLVQQSAEEYTDTEVSSEAAARDAQDDNVQAFAIQRANHTGTQTQSTVTDLVSDLAAKSTPLSTASQIADYHLPKLYHDFSLHPDGTILTLGDLPDIGMKWRWSAPSSIAPIITGGYLRGGAAGELFYFGTEMPEPIKSITFDVEFVPGGAGIGNIGTIYAFNNEPLLEEDGNGILLKAGMLHVEVNEGGISKFGFSEIDGSFFQTMPPMNVTVTSDGATPYANNTAGGGLLGRGRHQITFTFVGKDCLVTVLGQTWVFRHPPARGTLNFSGIPSDGDIFTAGGVTYTWRNSLSVANDVKIGASILISATNANAALNAQSGGAGTLYGTGTVQNPLVRGEAASSSQLSMGARRAGPVGNAITISESGANTSVSGATLTGGERTPIQAMGQPLHWWYEADYNLVANKGHARLYRVFANAPEGYSLARQEPMLNMLTASGQNTFQNDITFTGNNTHSGSLSMTGSFSAVPFAGNGSNKPVYNINLLTSELSSAASASGQALLSIGDRQLTSNGAWTEVVIDGVFGANANNKRVQVTNAIGTLFDTGTVAHSGKQFRLTIRKQRNSSNASRWVSIMEIQDNPSVYGRLTWGFDSALAASVLVTGVAAGDVFIMSATYTYGLP